MKIQLFTVLSILVTVHCIPAHLQYLGNGLLLRSRRSPNHAMLFTGYYGQPAVEQRNGYFQEQNLNGEPECKSCDGEYGLIAADDLAAHPEVVVPNPEENPNLLGQAPTQDKVFDETMTEVVESATQKENGKSPKKPNHSDSDEDDDSSSWPIPKSSGRHRPFFNFFPITFGGYDKNLGRSGGIPSGATAIANSFSTGKGGVATSHATAYGDPSAALRNANWNLNARYPSQV